MRRWLLGIVVLVGGQGAAMATPPRLGVPLGTGESSPPVPQAFPLAPAMAPPLAAPPVMEVFVPPRSGLAPVAAPLPLGPVLAAPTPIEPHLHALGVAPAGPALSPPVPGLAPPPHGLAAPGLHPGGLPPAGDRFSPRASTGYPATFPPPTALPTALPGRPGVVPAGVLPPGAQVISSLPPSGDGRATLGPLHGTGPCGPIGDSLGCRRKEFSDNPFGESLSVFLGLDSAKEPIDLGINSRFGYRFHLDWGLPIHEDLGLGLHLGAGYNHGNNSQRILRQIEASRDIHQAFFTVGLFQRTQIVNWEFAWDFRSDDYYESINTSQWRGLLSFNVNERNELGLWGTYRDRIDRANLGPVWFNVKPINQLNLFWRHTWDYQIVTSAWVGIAEEHGRLLALLPGESAVQHPFVFGASAFVPLSDQLALWGEAQFITPNDSGTVVATVGFAWYPFGRAPAQPRGAFAPLLPTANNASFTLDAQQN